MDMVKLNRHCYKVIKWTGFLLPVLLITYITWTLSVEQQDEKLNLINLMHQNGKKLVIDAGQNPVLADTPILVEENVPKQYDLRIITIVYNRAESLLRLLNSLNDADYLNDQIKLEVWIDRSKTGKIDENVLITSKKFKFKHGDFSVHPHAAHVGIYGQWLYTWKPVENSSEIAVILEDDCVVSPLFYKFLKFLHNKYDSYPRINGYSLQGISMKHGGEGGFLKAPYENSIFIYPVIGSWGFSPSTKNWMKFLDWFKEFFVKKDFKPYVPGNIATSWYQGFEASGKQSGMWTIWHIYYAWKNNEFTLYPNLKGHQGLTANWKEAGLHFTRGQNKQSNPLLMEWLTELEKLPDKPVKLDLNGNIMK